MAATSHAEVVALYPEQIRAIDYLRHKGTLAARARLVEQLDAAFAEIDSLLASVSPERRVARPEGGGWCIHEIVDHLAVTHALAADELRGLLAGQRPANGPIPPGLQSDDPFAASWDEQLDRVRAAHRAFADAVRAADDAAPHDVRAPVEMVVKVPGEDGRPTPKFWVYELDWKAYAQAFRVHTIEHANQVKRILGERPAT